MAITNVRAPPVTGLLSLSHCSYLLEILSELNAADQRAFLRFVTGCPRLPPGGLAALQPRLTVVRKHPRWDLVWLGVWVWWWLFVVY